MVKKTKGGFAHRELRNYTHYLTEAGALNKISLLITLNFFLSTFQLTVFQFKVISDGGTTYYSSDGQASHRSVFLESVPSWLRVPTFEWLKVYWGERIRLSKLSWGIRNCGRFARRRSLGLLGLKSIRPMTYNTLQHGEPSCPRCYFS